MPVLRVVESDLRRLGHQEGRQSVGQCRDRALQGLEVFGGADHAPIAAFGFDLLLDVLDLGPDLREAIPRLLWGLLWMSPLAGFALGHGRSPCDGSVGKRRLSTGVWEKRNPAPRHRFFRDRSLSRRSSLAFLEDRLCSFPAELPERRLTSSLAVLETNTRTRVILASKFLTLPDCRLAVSEAHQ